MLANALCFQAVHPFICFFVHPDKYCYIVGTTISYNALNNFVKTDREYLLAPTADLIRCCRSRVRVKAGRRGGEDIDAGVLKSIF